MDCAECEELDPCQAHCHICQYYGTACKAHRLRVDLPSIDEFEG